MKRFYRFHRLWLSLLFSGFFIPAAAQEEVILSPVTRTYAITNVTVIPAPGRKVDLATVIIKNGLIHNVGKSLVIPPDAIVIKADSMFMYAGFIDGYSKTGVVKPKEDANRERPKDPGNPDPERAGITPQNEVRNFLNPNERSIEELRAIGFTTAQVVPYGGMLPGSGAIIQLGGTSTNDLILVNKSSFYAELTSAQRVYPNTIIGVMAKFRELYRQAALAKEYETLYASNRAGLERPVSNGTLEAFYPVIDKRTPVLFKAEKFLDAHRVLALQSDLGFQVVLGDLKDGWDMIGKIKSANAKVFLSLDLPEEKKEDKKEGDKAETKKEAGKPADIEKEELEKRKAEFIALYSAQAAAFQKAGVSFGFSTNSVKVKDIPANLRRMIGAGLTEDQALAALTTAPAQLLGISDRVGTIDNGKIANLVITDKSYFNEKAKVRYVFVDGVLYHNEAKDEKKSNGKKAEPSGTWSYTTETPQGNSTGTLKLKNSGGAYSGSIISASTGQETQLQSVSVDGNLLSYAFVFSMGGTDVTIEVSVTLNGSEFEGTMSIGQWGSFPISGTKKPNQ